MQLYQTYMREALSLAKQAAVKGEVPIGAVVVHENKIIACAHNEVETERDATAHAEILAIQRASAALGSWRLDKTSLFVTLEPCSMCIGALILARVENLYFGCYDPRQGAVGSLYNLCEHPALPHKINVYPEVLASECEDLLKSFFAACRRRTE